MNEAVYVWKNPDAPSQLHGSSPEARMVTEYSGFTLREQYTTIGIFGIYVGPRAPKTEHSFAAYGVC